MRDVIFMKFCWYMEVIEFEFDALTTRDNIQSSR